MMTPLLLVCVWLCGAIGARATAFFGFRTSDTNIQRDRVQGLLQTYYSAASVLCCLGFNPEFRFTSRIVNRSLTHQLCVCALLLLSHHLPVHRYLPSR